MKLTHVFRDFNHTIYFKNFCHDKNISMHEDTTLFLLSLLYPCVSINKLFFSA